MIAIITWRVWKRNSGSLVFPQGKGYGRPHAKQCHKHGLDGMNDENKECSLSLSDAIKHQNRLHGKVPRASTIRCGNKYGKSADHKSHERSQRTKSCCKVEAEESQVEMQVIAHPNANGIDDEKQRTLHFSNGKQTILQV